VTHLELPYLTFAATIDQAEKTMRDGGANAVVVDDGKQAWLIRADAVYRARKSDQTRLVEVPYTDRMPVNRTDRSQTVTAMAIEALGTGNADLIADIAPSLTASYEYAAVPLTRDKVALVAREPSLLEDIAGRSTA
jgi:hypothetical protein